MEAPRPKKDTYLQLRISQALKSDAEQLARSRNTTLSQLITDFLTREIKSDKLGL